MKQATFNIDADAIPDAPLMLDTLLSHWTLAHIVDASIINWVLVTSLGIGKTWARGLQLNCTTAKFLANLRTLETADLCNTCSQGYPFKGRQ